jgi:opacity protein-like surface antigen
MKQRSACAVLSTAFAFALVFTSPTTAHADPLVGTPYDSVDSYINDNMINSFGKVQDAVHYESPENCAIADSTYHNPLADGQPQQRTITINGMQIQQAPGHVQPEIGIGVSKFGLTENGTWYQESFPYGVNLYSPAISLGIKANLTDSISIRAGYQNLGTVTSHAEATASDANYAACHYDHSKCWPLSSWYGQGSVQQAYITLDGSHKLWGVTWIGEAGVVYFKPTWTETIPNWISSPTAQPELVVVSHDAKLQAGYTLGFGVQLDKNTTLMLNMEKTSAQGDQFPAIYSGTTYTLQLRSQF